MTFNNLTFDVKKERNREIKEIAAFLRQMQILCRMCLCFRKVYDFPEPLFFAPLRSFFSALLSVFGYLP